MKALFLCTTLLLALGGGDRERGLRLYRDGDYAGAQAAFAAACTAAPDDAELQWNLALAAWRAGDLAVAETAAEKYAALAEDARQELHRGLLGAVRFAEAEELERQAEAAAAAGGASGDPLPLFEQALAKATQAKDHFVRGARAKPLPELVRNTERALRKIERLQKRIEELEAERQQREQQQEQQQQQEQKDPSRQGESGDQQEGDQQEQEQGQQPEPQPQQGEPPQQEPQPKDPQPGEGQPGEGQEGATGEPPRPDVPEPQPAESRHDAPGEAAEGRELTPEQAQRLKERLRELEGRLREARIRARRRRKPVERDW